MSGASYPAKVPYVEGSPTPTAPPGYVYVLHDKTSILSIILCIIFFPWGKSFASKNEVPWSAGVLCLLCLREKYWLLQPAGVSLTGI